jgi:hypothetical protein
MRLLVFVAEAQAEISGRRLVINGAGARWSAAHRSRRGRRAGVRGFVLIARTAGLVAHLAEEAAHPIGLPRVWLEVEGARAALRLNAR